MEKYSGAVQVILIIIMLISCWHMIDYANRKRGEKEYWFLNPILIIDYISLTRTETGKTGRWFWLFLCSLIVLIGISIAGR
ncbi:MAG TPA: hypothetical protein VKF36_19460 [Syntrophorhabdales bacterium]|nr:hypothetical protein [Syntrophorhabdales bacterium]